MKYVFTLSFLFLASATYDAAFSSEHSDVGRKRKRQRLKGADEGMSQEEPKRQRRMDDRNHFNERDISGGAGSVPGYAANNDNGSGDGDRDGTIVSANALLSLNCILQSL